MAEKGWPGLHRLRYPPGRGEQAPGRERLVFVVTYEDNSPISCILEINKYMYSRCFKKWQPQAGRIAEHVYSLRTYFSRPHIKSTNIDGISYKAPPSQLCYILYNTYMRIVEQQQRSQKSQEQSKEPSKNNFQSEARSSESVISHHGKLFFTEIPLSPRVQVTSELGRMRSGLSTTSFHWPGYHCPLAARRRMSRCCSRELAPVHDGGWTRASRGR